MAHLWGWFADIASTRQTGGMGPSRISRAEIAQWERDERIDLEQWERRAILRLDALQLEIMTPKAKA